MPLALRIPPTILASPFSFIFPLLSLFLLSCLFPFILPAPYPLLPLTYSDFNIAPPLPYPNPPSLSPPISPPCPHCSLLNSLTFSINRLVFLNLNYSPRKCSMRRRTSRRQMMAWMSHRRQEPERRWEEVALEGADGD